MSNDFMNDLDKENRENLDGYLEKIKNEAYRYYEKVTITDIKGDCPYGHKKHDVFKVTNMNSDSMCGSLYQSIHPNLTTIHYGGTLPWEKESDSFKGICPEHRVSVEVKRIELEKPTPFKTENRMVNMTGKGFSGNDRYKIFLEVLSVANNCTWGHKDGHRIELDNFNIGKVCGFMYWEIYQYVNLLLSGGCAPWEAEPHILHGCCPDPFNQVTYRLVREER